ncbi:MAG: N-acetylmuramoyl-L-alanine amidase [Acidobacteria bacterium]|nr:N-acetylmuramoyl-L-alanine amidase [Acidobacteriota bacterium]MCW5968953.1 N-acetylmuramoyl-L-alanine amidase [Blastocatellales bacterium]
MSEKVAAPAIEPYLRLVEQYASSFERPEMRLRFLNRTLARQSERERLWRGRLRRFAFIENSAAYRWLLDFALYRTIFEEFQRLLPDGFRERRRLWRQAPVRARIFFELYRARRAVYAAGILAGVMLLAGAVVLGRWAVRGVSTMLDARRNSTVSIAAPVASAIAAATPNGAEYLPDYRPEKVWLVEKTAEYERYSNGGRILTRYETTNHPRSYLRFPREGWPDAPGVQGRDIIGIVYHSSESDIVPFIADNTQSIQARTRGLIEYVRERRSYNYLIDRFGEIHRLVRDDHAAHHAGHSIWADADFVYVGLNESFIGICFESTSATGSLDEQLTEAQMIAGRALTGILRSRYQIADAGCTTHGLVSINPERGTIAHHHDWVRNFPFAAFSLSDKYATRPPSIELYAFGTDEEVRAKLGGWLWEGAAKAAAEIESGAAAERDPRRGLLIYRAQMNRQKEH